MHDTCWILQEYPKTSSGLFMTLKLLAGALCFNLTKLNLLSKIPLAKAPLLCFCQDYYLQWYDCVCQH